MTRPLFLAWVLTLVCVSAEAAPAARNGLPCVSPDGAMIAFLSDRDTTNEVWVIGTNGKNERRVPFRGQSLGWFGNDALWVTGTDADSGLVRAIRLQQGPSSVVARVHGRNPVMAPQGKRVLYLSGPWTSTAILVAETPDGAHARAIAGGRTTAWNGAWAPDGNKIAYTYGDSSRVLQVHVVNANGAKDHAVTHMSAQEGSAQMPSWSPDGKKLAFQVSQHKTKTGHIWIVDLTTGETQKLAPHADGILDEVPSWFPDGKRLTFQSTRSGTMEIWTMGVDGSGLVQVTGGSH